MKAVNARLALEILTIPCSTQPMTWRTRSAWRGREGCAATNRRLQDRLKQEARVTERECVCDGENLCDSVYMLKKRDDEMRLRCGCDCGLPGVFIGRRPSLPAQPGLASLPYGLIRLVRSSGSSGRHWPLVGGTEPGKSSLPSHRPTCVYAINYTARSK